MIITEREHGNKDQPGNCQNDEPLSVDCLDGPSDCPAHQVAEVEEKEAGNWCEVCGGEGAVFRDTLYRGSDRRKNCEGDTERAPYTEQHPLYLLDNCP